MNKSNRACRRSQRGSTEEVHYICTSTAFPICMHAPVVLLPSGAIKRACLSYSNTRSFVFFFLWTTGLLCITTATRADLQEFFGTSAAAPAAAAIVSIVRAACFPKVCVCAQSV